MRSRALPVATILSCVLVLPACRDCEDLGDVQPAGAIEPAIFEFGPLTIGSECTANLKVTNNGQVDLSVTASSLEDQNGDWTISKAPALVKLGAAEDLLIDYVAAGTVGELQSTNIELVTDDPDNEGILRGIVTAIVTDAPAPSAKSTCADETGADVSPCTLVKFGAVQINGGGLVLPITITNDGTEEMNVTAALINEGNPDFTVESVTRGTTVVELPTTVLPGRSADCGAPSGADNTITINVRYIPTATDVDVDTLLVLTDAVNVENGTLSIGLDGQGADTGIFMTPDRVNFGALPEGDTGAVEVLVKNIGTLEASVNFSCIDLENDDVCDAECTGDPEDTALSGTLSCIVTTFDGGVSGKGFVLAASDAAQGGDDERKINVTWAPVAGATSIPATAVLALHSNILGNRVFTAPLQGGSIGILEGAAAGGSDCPDGEADICVFAEGTPGVENFTTWAGSASVRLTNTGLASVTIESVRIDGDDDPDNAPSTIDDDYQLVKTDLAGSLIEPGETLTFAIAYDEVAPGNDAAASSELTNIQIVHDGAGLVTTLTIDVIPPQ